MPFALVVPVEGTRLDTTCAKCLPSPLPGLSLAACPWLDAPRDLAADRRFALQDGARQLAGSKALDGCFRRKQFGDNPLQAVYYPERQSAGLKNVQTCGSRWACPVCAALLSELSRRELKAAIDAHEASVGVGSVLMATFTVPHYESQSCAKVLGSQTRKKKGGEDNPLYGGLKLALSLFAAGRAGQALYQDLGIVGTVRNLEVTHGGNGWHCHSHAVWFLDHVPTEKEFTAHWLRARNRWLDCVGKSGLPVASPAALKKHGFRLTSDKAYIEDYVTKLGKAGIEGKQTEWHLEHELAKQPVKLGKHGGRTPMQLLADYTFEGDAAAGLLWAEYASVYRGSKQLYWSKGLRGRLLGSDREYTDEELLGIAETGQLPEWARPPAHAVLLEPTPREYSKICTDGSRGLLLALTRLAGTTGDRTALDSWFDQYKDFDRTARPLVTKKAIKKAVSAFGESDYEYFDVEPYEQSPVERLRLRSLNVTTEFTDADAPPLAEGETEVGPPKTLQTELFGGGFVHPLTRDADALAFWPGLTTEAASRYQRIQAEWSADGGDLPFFAARKQQAKAQEVHLTDLAALLGRIWTEAGGKGRVTRCEFNPWPGQEGYDPSLPTHKALNWSDPGRWAVWRFLAFLNHLAPELAAGSVPVFAETLEFV